MSWHFWVPGLRGWATGCGTEFHCAELGGLCNNSSRHFSEQPGFFSGTTGCRWQGRLQVQLCACAAASAKSLQSCLILCDPIDGSPPGSPIPSLGFSRQEHWSGLPFPSPMHESEKWKWSRSVVTDSSWPHGLQPTRLLRPWDFPGKSTGVGCHCLLRVCLWIKAIKN